MRPMRSVLETVGWLAAVVYSSIPSFWLVIHPQADYWRARQKSPYRVLLPAWVGMWIALALLTRPWRRVHIYETNWSWAVAALLFATGIYIYSRARRQFTATLLSGRPELEVERHPQTLVTGGIRDHVRHPIYLGHLVELVGWAAGTGLAVVYALLVFAVLTGWFMIRLEDRELEQRFGEPFRDYKRRVPAILPRI